MSKARHLGVLLLAVTLMSSCSSKELGRTLSAADDLMWTKPDSALAILRTVDTLKLRTRAHRARYSLLYTMALDRNHLGITNIGVIEPAARYYQNHGSKDDKMKMHFYLGVCLHDTGDLESAIQNYIQAKEYSSSSDNLMFRGLILSVISDVYNDNHNYEESILYGEEACRYFAQARDSFRLWNTTGSLASRYLNSEEWSKADSLYSVFFSQPVRDSSIYSMQLFNLAWSYIFRPKPDWRKSVELFTKAIDSGGRPSSINYCVYAYASDVLGHQDVADDIMNSLECAMVDSTVLNVWRYRILKNRGDYKQALTLLERSVDLQSSELLKTIGQSVALAQSDYYENKSLLLEKDRRAQKMVRWIVTLLCLLVAVTAAGISLALKRRWNCQMEEMSLINDEVNRRLDEAVLSNERQLRSIKNLTQKNKSANAKIDRLNDELSLAKSGQMVVDLRKRYVQAYKEQYHQLNELCRQYWEASRLSRGGKDRIYAEVKEIVSILDEPNHKQLEAMIDDGLDGIMKKLRSAMPGASEKDFRFIAFVILGFDAKTIARMMNYSVNSVYTKRSNLKEKLLSLAFDDKEIILALMT